MLPAQQERYNALKRKYPRGPAAENYRNAVMTRRVKRNFRQGNASLYSTRPARAPTTETKAIDVVKPTNPPGNNVGQPFDIVIAGEFTLLCPVPPGSAAWQRQGRQITLKSLHIRGFFNWSGTVLRSPGQYARLIVFYDKQTNGSFPNKVDLLQDQLNNPGDLSYCNCMSGINLNNRSRFEIIVDKTWQLPTNINNNAQYPPAGYTIGTSDSMDINIYRKLKNRQVEFKGQSVACEIGDVATGSLVMFWIGSSATVAEACWNAIVSCRTKFTDG